MKNWTFNSEMIFPTTAKCTYESYGPSGSDQKFDALCLLSLNILNQKLFFFIWIWYIVQLFLSVLNIAYWFVVLKSEKLRIFVLHRKTMKTVSHQIIKRASRNAHLGHFFVLSQISKNTCPLSFIEIISDLANVNDSI